MCGIIGYTGPRPAVDVLIESLRRLEYRGYNSAGIAVLDPHHPRSTVVKTERKVEALARRIEANGVIDGRTGIGHTRWATHGRPTEVNAHPHRDCTGGIHLIHNGIIENYRELRAELLARGHRFLSDTDTEVMPHLIEELYEGDLSEAVRGALRRLQGAYALVCFAADEPDVIVGARLNAPLVVGLGHGETFISSDITALIPYTKRILLLGEGEVVTARPGGVVVSSLDGTAVEPRVITADWDAEQAQKDGYPHFLLKEIHEQPQALQAALRDRISETGLVTLPGLGIPEERLAAFESVTIVACGTAWIAGLVARYAIESLARLRVDVEPASEFRYRDPLVDERTLVVAISQSGETADTLAAVREAQRRGATVVAITNVVGSALSLEADGVVYMQAGPEISVAATKTFVAQMACGILLALHLGDSRGTLDVDVHRRLAEELMAMPVLLERTLGLEPQIVHMAGRYAHARNAMYIGRGINFPVALEGALKLKEVSYLHAEGYAAGELKHGPIALLDPEVPVVAIATRARTLPKTVSNIEEVRTREAPVIALVTEGENPFDGDLARDVIEVPACEELLSPLVNVLPLQLLAYHIAVQRGCDVDQPRNLAKSVTVVVGDAGVLAPAAPPPVGIDVTSVSRLRDAVERNPRLARRAYTEAEIRDCERAPRRWASRWAAKEAVRKLAGSGGLGPRRAPLPAFRDVEVGYDDRGAPWVRTPRGPAPALSISHEGDLVVAVAVAGTPDPLDLPPVLPPPADLVLPPRSPDAHKGDFGTVTVLAGAHGYSGAAYLSGMGAARGGAGRIHLCVPASLFAIIAVKCTEVMTHGLPDGGAGTVGEDSVAVLERDHLPSADALVAGPGLGQAPRTVSAIAALLERLPCPTVVDADGLNIAAARRIDWRRSGQPVVLTPHPAEMGRLCGTSAREVQAERIGVALRYAAEHGVVVVLKGAETVIAGPDGRLAVDGHRVVALASGGTGDVLAGLIGAMLAGGLPAFEAAHAGVVVHAEAGAIVEAVRGRAGALAGDVLEALPAAQERVRRALPAAAGAGS